MWVGLEVHTGLCPPSPPPAPPQVCKLVHTLVPSFSPEQQMYAMALFDTDGDGIVNADDIMTAFEEVGTSVDTLETAMHYVSEQHEPKCARHEAPRLGLGSLGLCLRTCHHITSVVYIYI